MTSPAWIHSSRYAISCFVFCEAVYPIRNAGTGTAVFGEGNNNANYLWQTAIWTLRTRKRIATFCLVTVSGEFDQMPHDFAFILSCPSYTGLPRMQINWQPDEAEDTGDDEGIRLPPDERSPDSETRSRTSCNPHKLPLRQLRAGQPIGLIRRFLRLSNRRSGATTG